jgi:hypothetical protein
VNFVPVGLHNPAFPSTIFSTTLDGATVLDNYAWTPTWPSGTGLGAKSSTFNGLSPSIPVKPLVVTLITEQARGSISLLQLPTAVNGYTTILDFNDNVPLGDSNYQAKLIFQPVPEPATTLMWLSGALSIGIMGISRKRRTISLAPAQPYVNC